MVQKLKDLKEAIACGQIRVSIVALFCLTVIGIGAMITMTDPENVIINIIIAIAPLANNLVGNRQGDTRKPDKKP